MNAVNTRATTAMSKRRVRRCSMAGVLQGRRQNAPSVGFADSSPAPRWSIYAFSRSTAERGRWIGAGRVETERAFDPAPAPSAQQKLPAGQISVSAMRPLRARRSLAPDHSTRL